jgi:hypothetical protein
MRKQRVAAGRPAEGTGIECRVYERHHCELSAPCQPAGEGTNGARWPATILDISLNGVSLLLRRRFEPQANLAIELTGLGDDQSCTGIARVVHARPRGDGYWVLGCKFFSGMTEDELQGLLPSLQQRRTTANGDTRAAPPVVPSRIAGQPPQDAPAGKALLAVHFQLGLPSGEQLDYIIRRLSVPADWPPSPGKTLTMAGGTASGVLPAIKVQVVRSWQHDGRWSVRCQLLTEARPDLVRALRRLAEPGPTSRA